MTGQIDRSRTETVTAATNIATINGTFHASSLPNDRRQ